MHNDKCVMRNTAAYSSLHIYYYALIITHYAIKTYAD